MKNHNQEEVVAVVGLGYVGLPLAVEFGQSNPTIGYNISPKRIGELISGVDPTGEIGPQGLCDAKI
jgi:UDP-N-acetyl-D-galactosamine dehydrogenase